MSTPAATPAGASPPRRGAAHPGTGRPGAVGFVGTGSMGAPMVRRLAAAGYDVVVFNRTRSKAEAVAAEAAATGVEVAVAPTPAEVAARCEDVIVMVGDESAAREALTGRAGIAEGAAEGSLVVLTSTVGPSVARELAGALAPHGTRLLDAPVSGTPMAAAAGELLVMAGGDPGDVGRVEPAMRAFASAVVHLGPVGSGSAMKLVVNSLVFAVAEGIAESLVLAERCGMDPTTAYEVFVRSAVSNPMMRHRRQLFVEPGRHEPVFRLALAEKDLRLIEDLAGSVGAPVPQAALNHALVAEAVAAGLGDEDLAALAVRLRQRAAPAGGR